METLGYLYGSVVYEAPGEAIAPVSPPSDRPSSPATEHRFADVCLTSGRSPSALLQFWTILASVSLLLVGTAPAAVADHLLRYGSQGSQVQQIQQELAIAGYYSGPVTGYYGDLTQAAVRRFQQAQGLLVDGIVGPSTRAALQHQLSRPLAYQYSPGQIYYTRPPLTSASTQCNCVQPNFQPVNQPIYQNQTVATAQYAPDSAIVVPASTVIPPVPSVLGEVLYRGDRGPAVTQLQSDLNRLGYYQGPITGYYGPLTENAVTDFQEDNDLIVTGVAGPKTVTALRNFGLT
ncbi:MAG: peptidoglycan-binding domain-containing protein [Synechococcales bacterium]|nr:peptidoglycan-binding domain-containing protein [Synechococcales bacterium]